MLKPKYQRFAELLATGTDPVEAYRMACAPDGSKDACYKGSQRLSKNVHILMEVESIRERAVSLGKGTIMELKEAMELLTDMIRSKSMRAVRKVVRPGKPDENQLQLFSDIPEEPEEEIEIVYEELKPADKLKAMEQLGKLQRWFAEDRRDDSEADSIDAMLDGV